MPITTWQKRASLPEQDRILKVTLNDTQLENVEHDKLFGVHINNNLSLENHINSVFSKVNRNIALLMRIKSYVPNSRCEKNDLQCKYFTSSRLLYHHMGKFTSH